MATITQHRRKDTYIEVQRLAMEDSYFVRASNDVDSTGIYLTRTQLESLIQKASTVLQLEAINAKTTTASV